MSFPADLPDDIDALKTIIMASQAKMMEQDSVIERKEDRIVRLEKLLADFKRALYGAKSEKGRPDQYHLALEDIETAMAVVHAEDEAIDRQRLRRQSHIIGEDVSERLDIVPAQFRVLVTRRPKYACRSCEAGVIQAPAKPRLIEGGMPTEATIASVIVSKYADHLPLYCQSQIYARQGVDIDRSTLAFWVGKAAHELKPVHDALLAHLKTSSKLFMDETPAPVLDPGRGKTKKGYFWALARDDSDWNGPEPPGVAITYAPGRSGKHAVDISQGFEGILQVDGYAGYNRALDLRDNAPIQLAYCWAHARRKLFDLAHNNVAPIAEEGLKQIAALYRIEMDSNAVERTIRPIALQRKNALFAGHDAGAQNWAMLASLIETCKLNKIEPHNYLTDVITAIVNGHKQKDIKQLLPWNFKD